MKKRIIDKACELFARSGFNSVTMDDIAGELSISKKTLYKCYRTKELLVEHAAVELKDQFHKKIKNIMSQNYNAIEEHFEMRRVFRGILKITEVLPMMELKKKYPEPYSSMISNELEIYNVFMHKNLARGIQQGYYRSDVEAAHYIEFYYTIGLHILENMQDPEETDRLALSALIYHIQAAATEKGREELQFQLEKNSP